MVVKYNMKKIIVLLCLILQSCGSYGVVSYNTPTIELQKQSYERNNYYYWNSWEYNYYRPNYLYHNDLWLRNRYYIPTYPIYRSYVRPKVKPKTRPRVKPPKRRTTRQPRVIPNNPPRRVNPPTRRITPRRATPTRSGNSTRSSTKQ